MALAPSTSNNIGYTGIGHNIGTTKSSIWKVLTMFCCLLNVIMFIYITQTFNEWNITQIPGYQSKQTKSQESKGLGTATSGKLFKLDTKVNEFNEAYDKINLKQMNNKVKFSKRCNSDKWIVLTTIFNVTSAILDYNNINGWCTVIAGDKKSINKELYNKYLNTDKVVYLDVNEQYEIFQQLNTFETYDIIPFNHFGRKNLGFLYAIMNGAKYIYDTDDDNKVIEPYNKDGIPILGNDNHPTFKIKEINDDRIKDSSIYTFNVFLLWSKVFIWPRGYDIAALTESFKWHKTVTLETKQITANNDPKKNDYIIQQWLSNIEPDYDALERLIGKNIDYNDPSFTMQYIFDDEKDENGDYFAVSIPNHLYIPFNAQMTIWDYRSHLFLYLPITVHGRVSDIWRSYFAETIMDTLAINDVTNWKLLYCPVLVNQYRNSHNYLADFQSELPLYLQTHELLKFLHKFANEYDINKASNGKSVDINNVNIGQILLDLYISLYEYNVLKIDDVKGIYSWINDIVNIIGWNQNKR